MTPKIPEFFTEPELKQELSDYGSIVSFQAGDIIIAPNKYIKVVPIILSGVVKVLRVNENGEELFLYYLFPGQSCAISLSNSLIDKVNDIKAIVEDNAEIIVVSSTKVKEWFSRFSSWRRFVLKMINECHTELFYALDRVAFKNIDQRLIDYLLVKTTVSQSNTIHITHQAIANELSTSREVISRLLKALEQQHKLRLFRNRIEIVSLV